MRKVTGEYNTGFSFISLHDFGILLNHSNYFLSQRLMGSKKGGFGLLKIELMSLGFCH